MRDIILKGSMKYQIKSTKNKLCQDGKAKGQLVGGNLSIIYSLCGSDSMGETINKIVFLEDLSEYTYHIDRMLQNLKRNCFFKNITGLIIGSFTKIKEGEIPFGKTPEEIIFEFCKELDIPIFTNFPAGHINDNRALVFGNNIEMRVHKNELFLNWDPLII
jgi:muramoyltetrapeptide carboxypeptidase